MNSYKVIFQGSRKFKLFQNEQSIGELTYTKWYNSNANIRLSNNAEYSITSKGFFGTTLEVYQNNTLLISYKMGWKGVNITSKIGGEEKKYLLKLKGILSSTFVLLDADQNELIHTKSKFKWNKMHSDYELICTELFENIQHKELMLLVTYHALKYQLAAMAAAA
jgi:hypothetical protein